MDFKSYITKLINDHALLCWDKNARDAIADLEINTCRLTEVNKASGDLCFITDIQKNEISDRKVRCLDFELNLCCSIGQHVGESLQTVPGTDWLLRNSSGTFFLNFDLVFFIKNFFLIEKGFGSDFKDKHSRRSIEANPLYQSGILQKPVINQILYCILAIALGKQHGMNYSDPKGHILQPVVVLSHDCDLLHGNDFFTLSIRIYRFMRSLFTFSPMVFNYFISIILNLVRPKRFFFDEAVAMADLEQQLGFKSTFYFINGKRGRYGARSGDKLITPLIKKISNKNEIGIHYNYKFAYSLKELKNQKESLERLISKQIVVGRAHYLALDSFACKNNLSSAGILIDESYGYSQINSFICGYAGAFYSGSSDSGLSCPVQIPLSFMDTNTSSEKDNFSFWSMIADVEKFGGLITLLFHPGIYNSFEAPSLKLKYYEYLKYFKNKKYRNYTAKEILDFLEKSEN